MHRHLFTLITAALVVTSQQALSQNIENGRQLARQCSVCHGRTGVSNDPEVPIIAGQHAFYLEKSLSDYRSGAREDRRMTLIAEALSDQDIADLAAWFASIEVTVTMPE